jgi:hypothetical protein
LATTLDAMASSERTFAASTRMPKAEMVRTATGRAMGACIVISVIFWGELNLSGFAETLIFRPNLSPTTFQPEAD